jgi:EmrB/QacA subfamily drug resistance transporter
VTAAVPAPCDAAVAAAAGPCRGNRHPTATLAACILGSSLAFVDGSVVNVALPALGHDLGAAPADLSWTINAYLLPLGALILLGGAMGDRYGRRRLLVTGTALFLAASLLSAAAPTLGVLLLGRTLQGAAAAALMPNSLALLGAGFGGAARGRAIGTWAGFAAVAGALGPLLGGWLVDAVGWRTIFLVNMPVGAAAIWIALAFVPESRDERTHGRPLDWIGAAAVTLGLALLTWGLTAAADPRAPAALTPAALALGTALLAAFLGWQVRRGEDALMPLFLMRTPSFAGVTLLTFLLYAALGGLLVLLPFLLIRIAGYSAVQAGAALLPLPLLIGTGSRAMGQLTARIGGRWPLGLGSLIVAAGFLLFLHVDPAGTGGGGYWHHVFPATLVVGMGLALTVAPLTTTVMASVGPAHVGAASGFNSAVARIGGLIATALLGFVFVEQMSIASFTARFQLAALIGAMLAAAAGLSALTLIRTAPAPAGTAAPLGIPPASRDRR